MFRAPVASAIVVAALLALTLTLTPAPSAFAGDTIVDPRVVRFSLSNGLAVVLVPDGRASVVGLHLRYRVGTRDDPPARAGLARLVQLLMLRRSGHVGEWQYDRLLDQAGGSDSQTGTGQDRTLFEVAVPSEELALPLWLWSEQMGGFAASLDDRAIDEEVAVLRNRRQQAVDNVPAGRRDEFVRGALYPPGHPYREGTWPTDSSLRGVTAPEVRTFVEPRYGPDNATLVVTGDFDPVRARALIEKDFAPLPARGALPQRVAAPPALQGETRLRVVADVPVASLSIVWPTPALGQPGDAELSIAAELLTGSRAGILRWQVVDKLEVASQVWASQNSRLLGSTFSINAVVSPGHTAAEVLRAIDEVLADLPADKRMPHLMRAAKVGYLIEPVFNLEQSIRRAARFAQCEDEVERQPCLRSWLARFSGVNAAALTAVMGKELPSGRRIVVEVAPRSGAPLAGQLLAAPGGDR